MASSVVSPALALVLGLLVMPAAARADDLVVFAAASLKTALDRIAADWQAATGTKVVVSYGSSATLARQIEQGAPADVFLSAATNWMDVLQEGGMIRPESRRDILGNTLVLVAHGADGPPVAIAPGFDLEGLLGEGRLAMGMVDSVPAGQYGREALVSLGVWDNVAQKVAQSENVRAALALVAAGEAPYGIVYGSDAIADAESERAVRVAGVFPEGSHSLIVYPVALTAESDPAAAAFLEALSSPEASDVFRALGFTVLPR